MSKQLQTINTSAKYLSDVMSFLPSGVLLNKGVTGCGGTYVELTSKRNSLILVPTIELAKNKATKNTLVVYGKIKNEEILKYINSNIRYKKIIGTYDCLDRLLKIFPEITTYFLLVDEYHILFNAYAFRNDSILFLLKNYTQFNQFCFMTATPLVDNIILEEIKMLDVVNIVWDNAVPIKLNLIDTSFTNRELLYILQKEDNCNYHIFLNSVKTIRELVVKNKITDYKVVCSETSAKYNRTLNVESTTTAPKKYNFYTATAFEGCDIFDPKGKTIILCDTNIATTILDISTLVRQICGRVRDSIYKEEIILILNTVKHRYAGISKELFDIKVKENITLGKYTETKFNTDPDPEYKIKELRSFSKETYNSFYVNLYKNELFFDDNLRKMDEYNFNLIKEIYNSSISVLKEATTHGIVTDVSKAKMDWVSSKLDKHREYTFTELETLFKEEFLKRKLIFDGRCFKYYFPEYTKKVKAKNKIRETYYKFLV